MFANGKKFGLKEKLVNIWRKLKFGSVEEQSFWNQQNREISFSVQDDYQQLLGIKQLPAKGSLNNAQARKWYLYYEAKIPEIVAKRPVLAERAILAYQLRCWCRITARDLMADRELASHLEQTEPNLTLKEVMQNQWKKGLREEALIWEGIINTATRSRGSVNEKLGLKKRETYLTINPLWSCCLGTSQQSDHFFENELKETRISLSYYEANLENEKRGLKGKQQSIGFGESTQIRGWVR